MRAFLPLALLAVTACYSPRAVEPYSGPYDVSADGWEGAEPLQASVWYSEFSGNAHFEISRPANVAIFALRPGAGVEMIYPAFGAGRRMSFASGPHLVRTGGSPYRLTGNSSMAYGYGPMYILLVASEGPLNVGAFHATGTMAWLRRSAITYSPYVTLEAVVGEIVPNPQSQGWTTAMHVVWPEALGPRFRTDRPRYMRIQCASGMIVSVPVEVWIAGHPVCPEQRSPTDSVPDDSTTRGIKEVIPPPPPGWVTASMRDFELREELTRLREEKGLRNPGPLELTPYTRTISLSGAVSRGIDREGPDWSDDRARVRRTTSRPAVERTRDRPERARPAARQRPQPTPQARPSPPPRPSPPTKPTKPKGGNGGDGGND